MLNWRLYILSLLLSITTAASASLYAYAVDIPNPRDVDTHAYVANPDGILRETESLNLLCRQLEETCGVQLAIVVIDSVDEAFTDAFTLSYSLFNQWGIGDKDRNTGVLILVATGTDDIQIRTGDGIEGILTDYVCSEIYDEDLAPKLSKWKVHEGLQKAVEHIIDICSQPENQADLLLGFKAKDTTPYWSYLLIIICVVIIAVQCYKIYQVPRCPVCGRKMWLWGNTILKPNNLGEGGEGIHNYSCRKHLDQKKKVHYTFLKKLAVTQFILWIIFTLLKYFFLAFLNGGERDSDSRGGGSFGGGHTSGGGAGGKY